MRYIRAVGDSLDEMRRQARGSALHRRGDMTLVWVNEADLTAQAIVSDAERQGSCGDLGTEERHLTRERFKTYSVSDFVGQCRMQARDNLDPDYSAFMSALASKMEQLEKATRGAGHALRSYQYGNASTELAEAIANECEAALAASIKLGR